MKKLFLTSSFEETASLFGAFEEELTGRTVTFIPTAAIQEEYNDYVQAGRKALEELGLVVDELEISSASPQEIESTLQRNDMIYVTGGNTFFLLQELKKSGADQRIRAHIQAGKIYIGESAGSIILSPHIEYVKEMDDSTVAPSLKSYGALNVIDFYPVPHHGCFPFVESSEKVLAEYQSKVPLVPITNAQAIVVEGEQFRIVGA
ncbi:Type 1 glutamine amidotransferase-like domain-containing protein [Paenibacillus polymyxa]|uniref:peptidase E n=1 Tax=Paenibacillus polymyxa TaxID=1406 RepID=UPI001BEA16FE|nr:Type 1 glutamine amidotransferase-like domain-containing protein [Paenibacillus polymyxa]MBT2285048.1 Type 1 glutamine amidotransferase-like domain-containing protein [Paenibacillus polymyxa]